MKQKIQSLSCTTSKKMKFIYPKVSKKKLGFSQKQFQELTTYPKSIMRAFQNFIQTFPKIDVSNLSVERSDSESQSQKKQNTKKSNMFQESMMKQQQNQQKSEVQKYIEKIENYPTQLNRVCQQILKVQPPTYKILDPKQQVFAKMLKESSLKFKQGQFVTEIIVRINGKYHKNLSVGTSQKKSKNDAAKKVLQQLYSTNAYVFHKIKLLNSRQRKNL